MASRETGSRSTEDMLSDRASRPGDGGRATTTQSDGGRQNRPGLDAGEVRRREAEEFGGLKWGSAFFGWLVAVGIAALLTALLSAAGTAIGLTQLNTGAQATQEATRNADTVGIVGGILLLAVLLLAYYAGGYVAGRMARFNGPRQGLGAWLIGLLITLALAVAGVVLGAEYNVLQQINLPRIPINEGSLTTAGLITLAAILVGTLLAAMAGGKAGTHYHRKVDRVGLEGR